MQQLAVTRSSCVHVCRSSCMKSKLKQTRYGYLVPDAPVQMLLSANTGNKADGLLLSSWSRVIPKAVTFSLT